MNKRQKQIISLLTLLIMLIAADKLLSYALEPMSRADYFRHDMSQLKKNGEKVDMIIIGNSRSVYGFDPLIFEEELGLENVYNGSVVGQQISSKYYIAESMIEAFSPRIVVFDVEWQSLNDFGTSRTQAKLLGLDRLTGLTKLRYIFDAFRFSEMIYAFSKPYRFRDNLFKHGVIANNLRLKKWLKQTDYAENYYGTIKGYDKGSACSSKPFPVSSLGTFNEENISEKSKSYLDRIVDLCRSKNIHLFLVSPPTSTMQQLNIGNYQEANDYYQSYAKEKGVPYHNMNMLKDRDTIFNDSAFYDKGHLCEKGAADASRIYARIIRAELDGEKTDDLFCQTLEELCAEIDRLVSVGADIETDKNRVIVSNLSYTGGKDIIPVFDIQMSADGNHYESVATVTPPENSMDFTWDRQPGPYHLKISGYDPVSGTTAYVNYKVNITKDD